MNQVLTLETIGDLDGGAAGVAINGELAKAAADLDDRGKDEKPRVVLVRIIMTQVKNGDVDIEVEAAAQLPKYRTAPTRAATRRRGDKTQLTFQSLAPDDPHQSDIEDHTK